MDGYHCLQGTPVGLAGEDLQCVGVDVHHCLVVGTPQPMEGEVVIVARLDKPNYYVVFN